MEEDIKIVKEKLKIIESLCTDDCINKSVVIEPLKYAIENILNRLEQLEKENEELKADNKITYEYKHTLDLYDYIPKSVIKEKIEELEKAKGKYGDTPRLYTAYDTYDFQTNILKELLE